MWMTERRGFWIGHSKSQRLKGKLNNGDMSKDFNVIYGSFTERFKREATILILARLGE